MKKLTLNEFRDYCHAQNFVKYSLVTDGQKWDSVFNPLRISITGASIVIGLQPNIIYFQTGGECLLHINSVKYIKLLETSKVTSFEIVCGDNSTNKNDSSYIVKAQ